MSSERSLANLRPFQPGRSGNPQGLNSRARLQSDFLRVLADDFARYGTIALVAMREKDPSGYIKAVASIMPKQVGVANPLDDISMDDLDAAIIEVRGRLLSSAVPQSEDAVVIEQSLKLVPALPETV